MSVGEESSVELVIFQKIYQKLLIYYLASHKATTFIINSRLGRIVE